jgi:hypothetical protein
VLSYADDQYSLRRRHVEDLLLATLDHQDVVYDEGLARE